MFNINKGQYYLKLMKGPLGLFILSGICISLMNMSVRILGNDIPTVEKGFFRNLLTFVFVIIFIISSPNRNLHTKAPLLQILRAALGTAGLILSFYAVEHANLSTVTAITFFRPVMITLLAIVFLGEVVHIRRWAAIWVGFSGVLVTVGFSLHNISLGIAAALCASCFGAMIAIVLKKLSFIDPPQVTVFWMGLIMTPITAFLLFTTSHWVWPVGMQWLWILSIGIFSTAGQLFLTSAIKEAELSYLLPFDFLRLIWMSLIGFIIFSQDIKINVLIGGGIILSSTVYIALREKKLKTQRAS